MGVYDQLAELDKTAKGTVTRRRDTKKPTKRSKETSSDASKSDTTTPRNHDTTVSRYQETTINEVRKALRQFGKEAATHRFTPEEKQDIADIIYSYSRQGLRTSENEIARIAVNFIVRDYKSNGEESLLHKILKALRE